MKSLVRNQTEEIRSEIRIKFYIQQRRRAGLEGKGSGRGGCRGGGGGGESYVWFRTSRVFTRQAKHGFSLSCEHPTVTATRGRIRCSLAAPLTSIRFSKHDWPSAAPPLTRGQSAHSQWRVKKVALVSHRWSAQRAFHGRAESCCAVCKTDNRTAGKQTNKHVHTLSFLNKQTKIHV